MKSGSYGHCDPNVTPASTLSRGEQINHAHTCPHLSSPAHSYPSELTPPTPIYIVLGPISLPNLHVYTYTIIFPDKHLDAVFTPAHTSMHL